ncbi:hypothetical protein SAMN03159496_01794 [Rhizobium sp. NFR07]|nr:hypothetical protein SAMN03159496_01794 [Rhizobium sp. NFR07]
MNRAHRPNQIEPSNPGGIPAHLRFGLYAATCPRPITKRNTG